MTAEEPFQLRVFVDCGIVEVFVNGRQCLALGIQPGRGDSLGVSFCRKVRMPRSNR